MIRTTAASLALGLALLAPAAQADPGHSQVDFSNGTGGWDGIQPHEPVEGWGTWVDAGAGVGGSAGLHSRVPSSWWAEWRNSSNPAVIGDYTQSGGFTISLDVRAESIIYLDMLTEVQRDLVLELRDYDNTANGQPYTSVWTTLGTIGAGMDWQHFSVTVSNPLSATLPSGWGGAGGEDADGGPALPAGTSFADVLRGVDEIVFTTAKPGWFYGFTYFDVTLDNISVSAVPEPSTLLLQALGIATLAGLVRRRRRA